MKSRDAILLAVAKARAWVDDLASGCVRSFAEIAERDAFIPPHTLAAIIDETGRHDAIVTTLAQAAPSRWERSPGRQIRGALMISLGLIIGWLPVPVLRKSDFPARSE